MDEQSFLKRVGQNLREARRHLNLTQEEVGKLSGVMRRHYQSIEAGLINMTLATLLRLSRALQRPPELLVRTRVEGDD